MKISGWMVVAGCACWMAHAEINYEWSEIAASGGLKSGEVVSEGGKNILRIVNMEGRPKTFPLLQIERPAIRGKQYVLRGQIEYENVAGQSYLEMWNYFPASGTNTAEQKYFTRTPGGSVEMAMISGSSGWRPFALPFDSAGSVSGPTRLEVNLVMMGAGTVKIGPLRLEDAAGSSGAGIAGGRVPWWSNRTGGVIGGISGTILGCLGSALTWCASKGKARDFVLITSKILIAIGVLGVVVAVAATSMRQPFWVWYCPSLLGVLLLGIMPKRYRIYQNQYAEAELRKIQSVDLGNVSTS
jgi:hypothetical protein